MGFELRFAKKRFLLGAQTEKEKEDWVSAIRAQIKVIYNLTHNITDPNATSANSGNSLTTAFSSSPGQSRNKQPTTANEITANNNNNNGGQTDVSSDDNSSSVNYSSSSDLSDGGSPWAKSKPPNVTKLPSTCKIFNILLFIIECY